MNRLAGLPQFMMSPHDIKARYGVTLEACPFCGGGAYLYASPSPHVVCGKCAADGPAFERRGDQDEANAKALGAWNVRTSYPKPYDN